MNNYINFFFISGQQGGRRRICQRGIAGLYSYTLAIATCCPVGSYIKDLKGDK